MSQVSDGTPSADVSVSDVSVSDVSVSDVSVSDVSVSDVSVSDVSSVASSEAPQYIRGVPHPLPAGERLLWEGAPSTRAMATHVFHWRLVTVYFAAMIAYWAVTTELTPGSDTYVASAVVRIALSAFVLFTVLLLARLTATTTWYAITSQRVVLRIGMVFSMSINIPFRILESAGVGMFKDGTGQVTLTIAKGSRIAYVALWPHCRVFTFNQPAPLLRGLTEPQHVADILANAVADAAATASDSSTRIERSSGKGRKVDTATLPHPAAV